MKRCKNQLEIFLTVILVVGISACNRAPQLKGDPIHLKTVDLPRVALVLGAGGSRAMAHLGVLQILEEEGIPIDVIVGSSAGSIIGAMYADHPNALAIKQKLVHLKRSDLLDLSLSGLIMAPIRATGPVKGEALRNFLRQSLHAKNFEDLKIPLVVVATEIDEDRLVVFSKGSIIPAVHASSALPFVFAPVRLHHHRLVDGGVIAPVPVEVARSLKPQVVIAVDISTPPTVKKLTNTFDIAQRSFEICFHELSNNQSRQADIVIKPNMSGYGTFDDQYNHQLYENGRSTARAVLRHIKALLAEKGIPLKEIKS